jgi:hypothetical protein
VLVPCRWFSSLLPWFHDHELEHHAPVFVAQEVAAEHVGRDRFAVDVDDGELDVVDMEVVGRAARVGDLPDLGGVDLDDLVDPVHLHLEAVDVGAAEPEGAGPHGLAGVEIGERCEPFGQLRRGVQGW